MRRFRGGLVSKAHRLFVWLNSRLESNEKEEKKLRSRMVPLRPMLGMRETEFFVDNPLVRIHFIIVMSRWTSPAPWKFELLCPGSLTSTLLRYHWGLCWEGRHTSRCWNGRRETTGYEPFEREREREAYSWTPQRVRICLTQCIHWSVLECQLPH